LREEHRLGVFENRVLDWRKLQRNEELHDLYCSSNVIRMMKSRRMRWAGHIVRTGGEEVHTEFWWGNLTERDHMQDLGLDVIIIFKLILNRVGWSELNLPD
jgi:hypothetical protein